MKETDTGTETNDSIGHGIVSLEQFSLMVVKNVEIALPQPKISRNVRKAYFDSLGEKCLLTPWQCGYQDVDGHISVDDLPSVNPISVEVGQVSRTANLRLRTMAAAVQTVLTNHWLKLIIGLDLISGPLECERNINRYY